MGQIRDKMVADMELRGFRPATCEQYERAARQFVAFHKRAPTELGTSDVRAWALFMLTVAHRSASTVNVAVAALKFLYRVTLDRPEVVATIRRVRGDQPQPDVLSGSEVARLIEHAPSGKHRAIFLLLYGAGLRISEALHLRPADIDSKRNVIHIRAAKNRHDRIVPLPAVLLDALRAYWKEYRPAGGWLFPGNAGRATMTRAAVHIAIRKAARAAGITKRVYPHLLRHTFATHLVETGTDLRTVQILLGHRSLESTERYTQLTEARLRTLRTPVELLGTEEGRALG
jgi:integrase/recombinase XerD